MYKINVKDRFGDIEKSLESIVGMTRSNLLVELSYLRGLDNDGVKELGVVEDTSEIYKLNKVEIVGQAK